MASVSVGEICGGCSKAIVSGTVVRAQGQAYHVEHFVCRGCRTGLADAPYYTHEGALYCSRDYARLVERACAKCADLIDGPMVTTSEASWHPACFVCTGPCGAVLEGGRYFPGPDGRPFCQLCYDSAFAPRCAGCSCVVSGSYMDAGRAVFHVECFLCASCGVAPSGGFRWHGARVVCELCASRRGSVQSAPAGEATALAWGTPPPAPSATAPATATAAVTLSGSPAMSRFVRAEPLASSAFSHSTAAADERVRALKSRFAEARSGVRAAADTMSGQLRAAVPALRERTIEASVAAIVTLARTVQTMTQMMTALDGFDAAELTRACTAAVAAVREAQLAGSNADDTLWDRVIQLTVALHGTSKAKVAEFELFIARALQASALAWGETASARGDSQRVLPSDATRARASVNSIVKVAPSGGGGGGSSGDGVAGARASSYVAVDPELAARQTIERSARTQRESQLPTRAADEPRNFKDYAALYMIPIEHLSKREYVRQEVIFEFIYTELQYVADLELLLDVFVKPIRADPGILSPELAEIVFCSLDVLLAMHQRLVTELQARQMRSPVVSSIADICAAHVSTFVTVYSRYASNHPRARDAISAAQTGRKGARFRKFLDECLELPTVRRLPLEGYIIKPVQRLCKYPLLIREMLKATEPGPEATQLETVQLELDRIVGQVNEYTRRADDRRTLDTLLESIDGADALAPTPSRLVRSGDLRKVTAGKVEERFCVVLDTAVLWCKRTRVGKKPFELRNVVPINQMEVTPAQPPDPPHSFVVSAASKRYVWQCESALDCANWLLALVEAAGSWISTPSVSASSDGAGPAPSHADASRLSQNFTTMP